MNELKIDRLNWQPTWPNEIWITDKRRQEEFKITLKQGDDIEIEFEWDYDYGGRGQERMYLPVKLIKDLLNELGL
jgi:hypothetical protein